MPSMLVFVVLAALVVVILLRLRRQGGLKSSPGAKRNPANANPVFKRLSDTLFDELKLPSKAFRQELGVVYPDLAMAFRQSLNLGVTRYSQEYLASPPSEALVPELTNRLLCNYHGFILPCTSSPEQIAEALNTFFRQKKRLYKVQCLENKLFFFKGTIQDNATPILITSELTPEDTAQQREVLEHALTRIFVTEGWELQLFRQTPQESGYVLVSADELNRMRTYLHV